ncbi:efflux RND transporter periplasmic adaptor subunit [Roseibium porphyridii]|uniref:Efflux RND transporter periplasmic adaptor subunit n=1 Tax=Roseibium porphyridii TaxID=2866279 RepID=A0ABY8F580_9HYPH|nr:MULTISPECIES: efflux RND transporter periplasmic adaptor subunit [Stappiaceae]QFT33753.1 Macrolide export protein MacA [Labrenzia sp. THAF82]WFE89010.1 efflux RND transporter periplasmic adaptor subunit [Roseibium sp. KMA01]
MRVLKYLGFLIVLIAGIAGISWWNARPPIVEVVAPYRGSAAEVVYATAVVEPVRWAKVTSIIRERITSLCGCEGMEVAKGDQLAELDSGDARATLAELEARQVLAKSDRQRAMQLLERRVVSQQVYDKAQSELIRVNAMIAAQKERLRDYSIVAPMDGVILRQDGSVGEVAEPGDVLFWIGQPQPLQLIAEVNEEDIPKVVKGQKALIKADAFPNRDLMATVSRITPMGDPVLKNYRVYLDLPDDTPLRIGMTAEINIVTAEESDTLLLPLAAFDGANVQAIAEDNTVSLLQVDTGIRGTRAVEVLDGVDPNSRIVFPYNSDLKAGQTVRTEAGKQP